MLTVFMAYSASRAGPPPTQALILDVIVNGHRIGKLGEFQARDGALYATRRELGELGLKTGPGNADEVVAVASLPGVSARLDQAGQTAELTAAQSAIRPAQLGPAEPERSDAPLQSSVGGVLNYTVVGDYAAGRSRVDTLLDARVFSPWGVASTQAIGRAGANSTKAIRLDSTYTLSDPETLRRVRIGDVISSGLAWTRPLRLGGGQIARDFGLRPDLVTFPVPSIAGQVAVPSTVDVLINGAQLLSTRAEPGPFELRQLPMVNGANDVALVVNDGLGQQVTRTVPIYTSTALLAAGLDAYSVEAGAVRLGYGYASNDYRTLAGSGSYRRGLNDWLTVSGHAEASPSSFMGGGGVAAALGSFAMASVAVAGSTAGRQAGMLAYGAIERTTRKLSLSVSAQWTDGNFRDLASLYDDPVPSRTLRASAGYALGSAGTVAIAYTRQRRSSVQPALSPGRLSPGGAVSIDPLLGPSFYLPSRTSLVSASYSAPLWIRGASVYATVFHDFANSSSSGAVFGISMALGDRNSASVGAGLTGSSPSQTLQASRSVVAVGDAGGQLYASRDGRNDRALATGQYKSPWSLFEVSGYCSPGQTAWRGSASGALVFIDGDVFASNAVSDSFAVVDTDGTPGLDVLYENRPVQRTGSSGRVLIPDLRSFEVNRVSVDPSGLPLDVDAGPGSLLVRPGDRSGVVLHFGMQKSRGALVRLVDEAGQALPIGTVVTLEGDGAPVPVGYGGEAFMRGLPPHVVLRATVPQHGSCVVAFDFRPVAGDIPTIGPLRCRKAG